MKPRVVIDSNEFIFGLTATKPAAITLIDCLADLRVFIPRMVLREVVRNLSPEQVKQLYTRINRSGMVVISDEQIPEQLVVKYVRLGLNLKGDAFIAAFAEWVGADYLISDNRHFLRLAALATFEVVSAAEFLARLKS